MDRGAWWATVHGVTKSQAQLSTHTQHPHVVATTIIIYQYGHFVTVNDNN